MIPALSYSDVIREVTRAFEAGRYSGARHGFVRMVGILFAPPASQLGAKEIVPNLNRFHKYSGQNVDFFCAGYAMGSPPPSWDTDYKTLPHVQGRIWSYSDSAFDDFRATLHKETTWRYSNGCDLILANAVYTPETRSAVIQFDEAIDLKLDEVVATGAVPSVELLFGRLFQYAEDSPGDDPTWGFSDRQGLRSLRQVVVSLLPKNLAQEAQKAAHFAIRDLSKRRSTP